MTSDKGLGTDGVGAPGAILHARALDQALALSRVGGDLDLLKELGVLFLSDSERMLNEVRLAVLARDAKALDRAAHTIKGCVSNFGAQALYDAALVLERMGRAGDLTHVDRAYQSLRTEMAQLEVDLRVLTGQD